MEHQEQTPETATTGQLDMDRLLKLRLVVGRFGEMDGAKWWNTQGVLGRNGAQLLSRGLPRTHRFAQARIVFTVARARCHELFDPPGCITLWSLPARLEDRFESQWHDWLDAREEWEEFFQRVESLPSTDLLENLRAFDLLTDEVESAVPTLKRSAEGKAVALSGTFTPDDSVLTFLAAGFSKGVLGKPAVPYAKLAE